MYKTPRGKTLRVPVYFILCMKTSQKQAECRNDFYILSGKSKDNLLSANEKQGPKLEK